MKKIFLVYLIFGANLLHAQETRIDSIKCPSEAITIKFSENFRVGQSQNVQIIFDGDMPYNSYLKFENTKTVIEVSDCPDDKQCWESKMSFSSQQLLTSRVNVKFEDHYNGKKLQPVDAICSVIKK